MSSLSQFEQQDWVEFLQWALPVAGYRWKGFKKVRRQVCNRLKGRMVDLSIRSLDEYRSYLTHHPEEWPSFREACRITISRFYRNRSVFNALRLMILPAILSARPEGRKFRVWSCGCASGEEPYTISMIWNLSDFPQSLEIVATDLDSNMLKRAEEGAYAESSLREVPGIWKDRFFKRQGDDYVVSEALRAPVRFERQDLLEESPEGRFDLILCRNLAFTYFGEELQRMVLERLFQQLEDGGLLLIGNSEQLIENARFEAIFETLRVFQTKGSNLSNNLLFSREY